MVARIFRNTRISRVFVQIPGLVGRSPVLSEFSDFPRFFADSGVGRSVSCHFHQLVEAAPWLPSFRIFEFSDSPIVFPGCWHNCPDLSDFRISRCLLQVAAMVARLFQNCRTFLCFVQIPGLVGQCPAISINWWRPPHDCRAFGFSDFRITRSSLQIGGMVARVFRIFRISRFF